MHLLLHSCTAPKAYQKIYLNDAEMELAPKKVEKFETNFQVYREGASGANGGKTAVAADVINQIYLKHNEKIIVSSYRNVHWRIECFLSNNN